MHEAFLLSLIEKKDDITLAEMLERLRTERSVSVGLGTLWRFFARRAVTCKKIQRTPPSRIAPTAPMVLDGPNETAFPKLAALLRKAAERTVDRLWTVVGDLLDACPPTACANSFAAAGYDPE